MDECPTDADPLLEGAMEAYEATETERVMLGG